MTALDAKREMVGLAIYTLGLIALIAICSLAWWLISSPLINKC